MPDCNDITITIAQGPLPFPPNQPDLLDLVSYLPEGNTPSNAPIASVTEWAGKNGSRLEYRSTNGDACIPNRVGASPDTNYSLNLIVPYASSGEYTAEFTCQAINTYGGKPLQGWECNPKGGSGGIFVLTGGDKQN